MEDSHLVFLKGEQLATCRIIINSNLLYATICMMAVAPLHAVGHIEIACSNKRFYASNPMTHILFYIRTIRQYSNFLMQSDAGMHNMHDGH